MKRLRVLLLIHHYLVPPEDVSGIDTTKALWRTEYDVLKTLRHELKHDVRVLGVTDELTPIKQATEEFKPHVVFNLLEAFHEVGTFDQNVVSYLELLRMSYTGCNPRGMILARDKALSKKLMQYHRIPVPDFAVAYRRRKFRLPKRMGFPLIVKSLTEEASIGISQASVVDDERRMLERIQFIHDSIGTDAIVEQYIEGRELYCCIVGNQRLRVFPIWEMFFENMTDRQHRIATARVKWNSSYQEKTGIMTGAVDPLPEGLKERIPVICKRAYRALQLSGYARIDMRLDAQGRLYVLEANPNPQIANGEDFARSADMADVVYPALIQRILKAGIRWEPERNG
ncbi:MAG: ATP-grasp domain-containing protein [Acidobacteria bacterium]|nr:ATP-grasp domain-containing protein [Acidobacteriota bacterium]